MKSFSARFLLLFISIACTGADDLPQEYTNTCDKSAIVSKNLYEQASSKNYSITAASISGDCQETKLMQAAVMGVTGKYNLKAIAESYPVQRYVKVSLESG